MYNLNLCINSWTCYLELKITEKITYPNIQIYKEKFQSLFIKSNHSDASYKYVIACTDMEGGQHYPPDTPWKFLRFAHVIFSIHSLSINSCESRRELIHS